MLSTILSIIVKLLIVGFVLGEVIWSVSRYRKTKGVFIEKQYLVQFLGKAFATPDYNFANLAPSVRKNPAADYIAACAYHGQLVESHTFVKLLSQGVRNAFDDILSTANTMPVIGLMGTFTGIIIGILQTNLKADNVAGSLQPLINSAGLAFSSSLVALICASILKTCSNVWRKTLESDIEVAERNLLVNYLPQLSTNNNDEMFARSVRRLERSVRGFSTSFENATNEFMNQFRPLVENQRDIHQRTATHIDSVAARLDANANALLEVSNRQTEQVDAVSSVTSKLTEASDALQASMTLASANLERFVILGNEMQQSISSMHTPLQSILTGQSEVVTKLNELFENVAGYNITVQNYLNSLNAKLDMFSAVGNQVHEVRTDFEGFRTHLNALLEQITVEAQTLHNDLNDSFHLYDANLRTLFSDVLQNRRDVHMAYYDPDVVKQIDTVCSQNKEQLENMEKGLQTLNKHTDRLIDVIEKMRGWGIYKVKREKQDKKS